MSIKSEVIHDSFLQNKINLKNYRISNIKMGKQFTREDILTKYSEEIIDECWAALSTCIIQNYQRGKGTLIKGFGLFTFKAPEIILKGTTNEFDRDIRLREPPLQKLEFYIQVYFAIYPLLYRDGEINSNKTIQFRKKR